MKSIICFLFGISCFAQSGSFDSSFGLDGKAKSCLDPGLYYANTDAGFQTAGKIITYNVNSSTVAASLVRWNTNGTIDTTFGLSGFVNFTQSGVFINGGFYPYQMAIQSDNKIIIMGSQSNNTYPNAYWIARLLPNGAFDTSFNGSGYRDLSFGTIQDRGRCVALQADGKILVGGTSGNTAQFFTVARLNSNGSIDTSFGNNGVVQTAFSALESFAEKIAVYPDGKILLGGYTGTTTQAKDFALVRYNSDGSIDSSFGTNGKIVTSLSFYSDIIRDIIIEPNGKILTAGVYSSESSPRMCMVRYLANGSIDSSFGTNGVVVNEDDNNRYCSIARQMDGKILLAGGFDGQYFLTVRYNNNGTKDLSFGTNGVVNAFPETTGYAAKVLIQPDNRIVVTGATYVDETGQTCNTVIRLNPGTLDVAEFTENDVIIYPNPSNGVFQLTFKKQFNEKISYAVHDLLGKKISQGQVANQNSSFQLNLENYRKGLYLLAITSGEAKIVKKLVVN